jgi:NitT/TauT family transport system ATP-binding protein
MVKVEKLTFAYKKGLPIFEDFDCLIQKGQRLSIIGPSGCGKSTLLYLLAGLRTPDSGSILVSEENFGKYQTSIGLVLQDYGLLPWATAFQNIALGLKIKGVPKEEIIETVKQWMNDLGIAAVASHFPGELSGGQRQRVAIARTLVLQPALLLMDEPFASLDTMTREDLLDLTLDLWHKQPSTMILVTHNIEEAVYWGSQILVLGKAPNTRCTIADNSGSGTLDFRESAQYRARCRELREQIENQSSWGKNGVQN